MNRTETTEILIGTEAHLSDGTNGEVAGIAIAVSGRTVSDLVICTTRPHRTARLVPLNLVNLERHNIELPVTFPEFQQLDAAEETRLVTAWDDTENCDKESSPAWARLLLAGGSGFGLVGEYVPQYRTYDKVPLGDVMVRRHECVHAHDGDLGKVEGVVIDIRSRRVTHVVMREGHLWGKKHIAIPMNKVTQLHDGFQLDITKQQVEQLPTTDLGDPMRKMHPAR